MRKWRITGVAIATIAVLFARSAPAQEHDQPDSATVNKVFPKGGYSTQAGRKYPTRVFFGDTHLHTSASMDAGAFGCRLGPADGYRFARGEELVSSTGVPVRLSRPLDFLVVSDHSDNLGFFPKLFAGDPKYLADPTGKRWHEMVMAGGQEAVKAALEVISSFSQGKFPKALASLPGTENYRSAWKVAVDAAEKYNTPGLFTAFAGYEWTSNTKGNNLHRVVIYRDGPDKTLQMDPYTTVKPQGSDNPRDLWKWMDAYQQKTGGRVLAIAHNGNLSNGIMFPLVESFTGKPVDREYATTRARWEPLYEVTQMKGDGETHPVLSPNDEFANFERWDKGNLDLSTLKKPEMLTYEYGRQALQLGLQLEQKLGVNPYKFGFIGSTDAHTALATADDDNFYGKLPSTEPSPTRAEHVAIQFAGSSVKIMGWEMAASGYAAVWAKENTREALFDAMQRRETYATTGPRMIVRFFGGWDYTAADAKTRNPAEAGYAKGVPMGGDLKPPAAGKVAPTFLVAALKDPIGANLDRIQVVKGWLGAKGERHEKIFDVVWSGNRKHEASGKLEAVGSTVDVENAVYSNTIGAPELITVWKDPEFNVSQRAVYYARVLEIPTPRWTAYDAKRFGVKLPPEVPMVTQERAYTSPIWYTPAR
jgi:hypothetical protein